VALRIASASALSTDMGLLSRSPAVSRAWLLDG
jgi:hypothetical protein